VTAFPNHDVGVDTSRRPRSAAGAWLKDYLILMLPSLIGTFSIKNLGPLSFASTAAAALGSCSIASSFLKPS